MLSHGKFGWVHTDRQFRLVKFVRQFAFIRLDSFVSVQSDSKLVWQFRRIGSISVQFYAWDLSQMKYFSRHCKVGQSLDWRSPSFITSFIATLVSGPNNSACVKYSVDAGWS